VRVRELRADEPASSSAGPAPLTRLDLLDAILPHCEPAEACLQNEEGRFAWLYTGAQVTSAIAAWRDGRLPDKCFETNTKSSSRGFLFDRPVRLGLVPHRSGKVGVFAIDLDNHEGGKDNTPLLGKLQRFFGAPAVVFRSKGGKGLHLIYRLAKPRPVRKFVKWAKAWGFNREGRPELFPKTHRLTQLWLPNEPNEAGGDAYVSGDFGKAMLKDLPPAPPSGLPDELLDFLMGFATPGRRNDLLNRTAFALGQRGCAGDDAGALCRRAAALCGLEPGETEKSFRSGFDAGREAAPRIGVSPATARLPAIVVNNRQLPDISDETWTCVHDANRKPPWLFLSGGTLARINFAGKVPAIQQLDRVGVISAIARVAQWLRKNEDESTNVFPPARVADDMLNCPDAERLPVLEGIIASPIFDSDGRLLEAPGYHPSACVWYAPAPGFDIVPVPAPPLHQDVKDAVALVLEVICDFPFVSEADRANCIASFLLPFVRKMIRGCTPLHLFEAPSYGSGKSKLPEVVARLATGRPVEPTVLPADNEECRKKITASLARGPQVILLDNASRLQSEALAVALTCEVWSDRLLGASKMLSLPNQAVWLATGNNPSMTMEIARRTIRIRIDPKTDRPWLRTGFRHDPLLSWVAANRPRLVRALLTLVRAWIDRGRPMAGRTLGSFEHWAQVMGGILECAGIEHFLGNLGDFYDRLDAEGRMWREFCEAAFGRFAGRSARVTEYNELCAEKDLLLPVRGDKGKRSQCIRLGKALTRVRDRMFGGFTIVPATDRHSKAQTYAVVRQAEGSEQEPAGCFSTSRGFAGCQTDTSRDVDAQLRLTCEPARDVAGSSDSPCTGKVDKNNREVQGVYGGGSGQNIPQLPAEQSNLPPANELAPVEPSGNIPQASREHPATELPADIADWPDEWHDAYEERVAVRQYDGGLPKEEAERLAEADVRLQCGRGRP